MFEDIFKFGLMVSFIDEISRPLKNAEKNLNRFEHKVVELQNRFAKMAKSGMKLASVGFGITASLASQTEAALEFSKNMAEVSTLVDTNVVNMARLKAKLLEIAPTLGMDTSTATRALYNIISAGVKASDALKVLELAGKAAVAGVTDVNTAATLGTQIMNAYGMSVKQLPHIYDLLFMTVKSGVTTFPELASYLGDVLASARAANVSFEQLSAAIAGMTKVGIRTPQAAVALKGLLVALAAPSSVAGKALEKFGGEEFKAAIASGNLVRALEILAPRVKTLADARAIIPDQEAAKAFLALTSHMKEFKQTVLEMQHSGGAMKEAFNKMAATSAFALSKVKSEMHSVAITIGMAMLPSLKALADAIYKVSVPIQRFILTHQKLAKAILLPLGGFGLLILAVGSFLTVLGFAGSLTTRMIMGYKNLGKAIEFLKAKYIAVMTPIKGFIASQWASLKATVAEEGGLFALSKAFALRLVESIKAAALAVRSFTVSLITSPIGIAIAAIAVAAGLIYKYWQPIKAFFEGVFKGIAESVKPLKPAFDALIYPVKLLFSAIKWLVGAIGSLLSPVHESSSKLKELGSVGERVGHILSFVFLPVLAPIKLVKLAIQGLKSAFKSLEPLVKGVFSTIKGVFLNFTPLGWMIKGFLKLKHYVEGFSLAKSGAKIVHTLVSGIKSVALAPYHAIKGIFHKLRKLLPFSDAKEGPLSSLTKSGASIITTLVKGMQSKKGILHSALLSVFKGVNSVANTIAAPVRFALEKFKLPSLKPLVAPIKFIQDKLKLPSLKSLVAPVRFALEKLKLPSLKPLDSEFRLLPVFEGLNPSKVMFPNKVPAAASGNINVNFEQHISINGAADETSLRKIGEITESAIHRAIERYFYNKERVAF